MRFACLLLCSAVARGGPPPQPPVLPPQLPVRQYSAWQSIQAPLARSRESGLAGDDRLPPYHVPSLDREPVDLEPSPLNPSGPARSRLDALPSDAARRDELDRREYELYLRGGLSDSVHAAGADAEAFAAAKADRDQNLMNAQQAYQARITRPNADRIAASDAFVEQTRAIQQRYQMQRSMILGDRPTTRAAD